MNIFIRKCDACGEKHTNDQSDYEQYSKLEQPNGERFDVCPMCVLQLFKVVAPA